MRRALALARKGRGRVEPNPMVGAVVVRDGRVVGEGYHQRYGQPHAEVLALAAAGRRAQGATLYVTLEPCCHWGKTPPCTDALLAADVARVVVAMVDPFAQVHGKGIRLLRRQGLRVDVGLLAAESRQLNTPFLTRLLKKRPYIIAKWAQSLDGCIATASGDSKWISSEPSRQWVHQLRGRVDGILIGIGTALADDPLLTARIHNPLRIPTRIVLDSHCRLPMSSRLVKTIPEAPLLLVHASELNPSAMKRSAALKARGVMTFGARNLMDLLHHLAELEFTNLLVEGGSRILASFFRQNLVDEAHVFVAPLILGDARARHAAEGNDISRIRDAIPLKLHAFARSGPDIHLTFHRGAV